MTTSSELKSRTQIKKEAEMLQKLGEKLLRLSASQLAAIDIPEELRDALKEAKTISSKNARRRQIQYIGALMRTVDPEPLCVEISHIESGIFPGHSKTARAKVWHDAILQGHDEPIDEIISEKPDTDRQKLRQLIRNARKEISSGKRGKSSNKLLNYLYSIDR